MATFAVKKERFQGWLKLAQYLLIELVKRISTNVEIKMVFFLLKASLTQSVRKVVYATQWNKIQSCYTPCSVALQQRFFISFL